MTEDLTTAEKFDFDLHFQKVLVKRSIEDSDWYAFIRENIVPQNYDLPELALIATNVEEFYEKNEQSPNYNILDSILKKNLNREVYSQVSLQLKELEFGCKAEGANYKYSEELAVRFSKTQAWKQFVINSAEFIDSGNIEEIEKLHEEFLVSKEKSTITSSKLIDIFNPTDIADRYSKIETDKVPTLFHTLDEKLKGGLSKGELGFILAPPYVGKSAGLVQFGTNALFSGKNVLHVTVELSKAKTGVRYDMCVTGTPYEEIIKDRKAFAKKLMSFQKLYKGQLFIEEFPSRTLTVQALKAFIKRVEKIKKIKIDELILDYADELKRPNWENTSYAVGDVVSKLRGMTQELNIATWSATQTNRAGFSKATIDMDDVADSWDKAKVADVMIGFCQSKEEEIKDRMRWIILKNRSNKRFSKPIGISTNFDIMRFKEI